MVLLYVVQKIEKHKILAMNKREQSRSSPKKTKKNSLNSRIIALIHLNKDPVTFKNKINVIDFSQSL